MPMIPNASAIVPAIANIVRANDVRASDRDQIFGQNAEDAILGEQPGDRLGYSAKHLVALACQHGDEHDGYQKHNASHDRDQVLQLDLAASRDLSREALHSRLEPVELELVGDPAGCAEAAG